MDGKQEARLIRRILHLRTMMRYAEDATVVLTLEEFIADTEAELVSLKLGQYRVVLH